MFNKVWRSVLCSLLLLFVFAGSGQASEEPVLVKHRVVKEDGMEAFIPSISGLKDKKIEDNVNKILFETVDFTIASYREFASDENLTKEMKKNWSFHSNYAVKYNKHNLFSVVIYGDQYTGGAHGISWRDSLTVNLASGKVYRLPDLFKAGFDYQGFIDKKIREQIAAQDAEDSMQFNGVDHTTRFYVTEEVLVIYYQPYELAAYVFGAPTFHIPIEDLQDMFADDVKIW